MCTQKCFFFTYNNYIKLWETKLMQTGMYDLPGLATHNFNSYDINYNYLDPNSTLLPLAQNPLYSMVCDLHVFYY